MLRRPVGIAFVLALALGVMPLATDWCAATCDHTHMAGANTTDPVCHHESPTSTRLEQAPQPCGHEHGPLPNLIADRSAPASLAQAAAPAVAAAAPAARPTDTRGPSAEGRLRPPPESIPLTLSFSLRV